MLQSSSKEISDKIKNILDIQNAQSMFNLKNLHERGMVLMQKKNAKLPQNLSPKNRNSNLETSENVLENDDQTYKNPKNNTKRLASMKSALQRRSPQQVQLK